MFLVSMCIDVSQIILFWVIFKILKNFVKNLLFFQVSKNSVTLTIWQLENTFSTVHLAILMPFWAFIERANYICHKG